MLLTLFGISVIIFVLLRIVPATSSTSCSTAAGFVNPAEKAKIERELGLDRPIAGAVRRLDRRACCRAISAIPTSPRSRRSQEILPRIPITAKLAGLALVFSIADRRAARGDQRGQAELRARLCPARGQPQRAVDAGLLARAPDPDGLRRLVRHDPDLHRTRRKTFWERCCCTACRRPRSASAARR